MVPVEVVLWAVVCAISVRKGQAGKAKRGSVMGTIDSQVSGKLVVKNKRSSLTFKHQVIIADMSLK